MAFRTQQGLQATGIYEFDLLEYLSSSEHIFLLDQQLVQKFHSTTTKSQTAQSKIKTPKASRYGGRNFTPQRDNQDHEIGNFLNLMSNCVDGPFKVVAKCFIISCRQNFGYVGLVKYAINKVQSDISSSSLTSTPNEYDSFIFDEKQYQRFLREFDPALYPRINKSYVTRNDKLNETTNFVNMKLNVEEHEQIIGSTRHDQGAKRKYNILFEDDLLNTLSDYQTSQNKTRNLLLHKFSILPTPLLSDNHHHRCRQPSPTPDSHRRCLLLLLPPSATEVKGNYVVLHHILKCLMSVTENRAVDKLDQMNRKRHGFAIEKIDKIGTKGHIFTFLRVTSPEINKRIRMWDYDASDICGEMFKCQELQGEKIAPQKE
ncbi:hypothetical protein M9H77_19084 [Catharanthus roseus]|uniref:Uncharacterized protein n=1 Tax=Catharanthus roseus TaxID=4058 RepID=A0ACC0B9B9_CATRO|nr:hypothetical protein M9H77_19084 [Catharanthus roseus]